MFIVKLFICQAEERSYNRSTVAKKTSKLQMDITTLDDLPTEIFYEVFKYMQLHEIVHSFCHASERLGTLVSRMPLFRVYLGFHGMNLSVANFYRHYLSQADVSGRLVSLCVSQKECIGSGIWLATHIRKFVKLRYLSLIDIKRNSFELMLDELSTEIPLVMFTVEFSTCTRALFTFVGVPEGAYHHRIFRALPMLRVCHLRFWRYITEKMDSRLLLPKDRPYLPIECNALQLQTLVLRECSPAFLAHLLPHLPRLRHLTFEWGTPWLPGRHSLFSAQSNS